MESRVSGLERRVSEQGKVVAEMKNDLSIVKDNLPNMKEIKELLWEFKKGEKSSEGGANLVHNDDNGEERSVHGNKFEEEGRDAKAMDKEGGTSHL